MDSASQEQYLEKLQELVEDEDRIVTVPFLAYNLKISVKESEKLLEKYVENSRKINSKALAVTYILTGITKNNRGRAVYMLKESDMSSKEELFEKLISEIIYSVQKNKNLDFNIIGLADWNDKTRIGDKPLPGTIMTKNYVKRNVKFKTLPTLPPPVVKGKSRFFAPKSETKTGEKSPDKKNNEKTPENKNNNKPKPAGGIANMFNNISASNNKSNKKNDSTKPAGTGKSKGGLTNFFEKSSSKSLTSSESVKTESNIKSEITEDLDNFMEVDFDEELETVKPKVKKDSNTKIDNKIETKNEEVKKENGTKPSKEKKKNSKRSRDDSEEKSHKKRKRIIVRNDSDSDDLFEREDEDVIEKSDEEPERIPSPVAKLPPPKSRIRKAVDKTYMDEDGFIVTNQEFVYESTSENENENPVPKPKVEEKPKSKPIEKKNSVSSEDTSPQKGVKGKKGKKNPLQNQPTLMNFFKKK